MKDDLVERAIQIWVELTETPGAMQAFEARQKQILDEWAAQREAELRVQEAYDEAYRKAYDEEMERVAQRLLAKDWEVKEIIEITELNEEQIVKIQQNMKNE